MRNCLRGSVPHEVEGRVVVGDENADGKEWMEERNSREEKRRGAWGGSCGRLSG